MFSIKKKFLAAAVLPVALLATSCRTNQTMWAACEPGSDPWGTDGTYVLLCRNGVWEPIMTVQEYVLLRQGKKVTIAPVPTRPTTTTTTTTAAPTTTTAGATTTTAAPTTTSTTTSTTTTTIASTSPSIFGVTPPAGPLAGGVSITITGDGFTGTSAVTFGGTAATSFTVDSDTQITATVPAHAAGSVDVVVTNGAGSATETNGFEYQVQPTVTGVSPAIGSELGGDTVTITGTGFGTSGVPTVVFGAVAATGVVRNSSTSLTVTSPAQPFGTVNVRVTTYGGLSDVTAADEFTYILE